MITSQDIKAATTPSKEDASKSYVLIGAARGADGEDYIVRFVVNQFNNELASINVLYAIKTKKRTGCAQCAQIHGRAVFRYQFYH